MGCGGSKQQDVATGNTVSTGKLSQKEAAASKSKASSTTTTTTTDVSLADDSLKSIVEKVEMAEINDDLQGKEKPATSKVVEVTEEKQLTTTNETPNEYLSRRKDVEVVEAEAGGEEVDHLSLRKDHEADVVEEEGMEKECREVETTAQEEEKEEVGLRNDDDGDSIGKSSNDFKETLSVEEMDEGEVVIEEKKIVGEGELLSGSSAP